MAQLTVQLDPEKLRCSICLDLLKDPVTIPCGHSYCMGCIEDCWGGKEEKKTHSCPQCRQSFVPRPVLVKSTILAELVEEFKEVELEAASPNHSYAAPGDVSCDFCTGIKLKALKSCLVCMASYCELHLQPHYSVTPLKKHKLVEATLRLQENICSQHDEVIKIFCRTDQQCICYLCSMDDHKGHDVVSAVTERTERQTELGASRQEIQQRIQGREKAITVLQQRVEAINLSADEAVRDSEKNFTEMKRLVDKRSAEVRQQIQSEQENEVRRAKELEEKLQQEIAELRRKDTELEMLSRTEDHLHFINNYPSVSRLSESESIPCIDTHPLCPFKDVAVAVSKARNTLQAVLSEECPETSLKLTGVEALAPQAEPTARADFLRYSCQITLDSNTANWRLSLSVNNRKATLLAEHKLYLSRPERFLDRWQVLSKEGLTGCCYWEVKCSGKVYIAVAYENISRRGSRGECRFGYNDKSWALLCDIDRYKFRHNNICTFVSGPLSSRIGVYLDHGAGTLCFYSISESMTLLHRVQTTFTQPLYPGFRLPSTPGSAVELCELK